MRTYRRIITPRWLVSAFAAFLLSLLFFWVSFTLYGSLIKGEKDSAFRGMLVCIDPGHPTDFNSGMQRVNGLREVDVNWQVALKLSNELESLGIKVVLTKDEREQLVSNPERSKLANEAGAVLMVRLHCDAGPSRGYTLYYPDKMGSDGNVYGPVKKIREASRTAAYRIHSIMNYHLTDILNDRGVRGESRTKVGEWKGALRGSVYIEIPVVTIEMVFLTDYGDAQFIGSESGQNKIAKAIADGIVFTLRDPNVDIKNKAAKPYSEQDNRVVQ